MNEHLIKQIIQAHCDQIYNAISTLNQREQKMARVSSDVSETKITSAMPAGTTTIAQVVEIDLQTSKIADDGSGGNPMAVLTWEVAEGPYQGRRVGFHYVMTGGVTKKGNAMPLNRLLEVIDALKVPWAVSQDAPLVARPFLRKKSSTGDVLFYNPDDGQLITNIEYDIPDDFLGKQARVKFGVRKGGDREFNEVSQVMPIS